MNALVIRNIEPVVQLVRRALKLVHMYTVSQKKVCQNYLQCRFGNRFLTFMAPLVVSAAAYSLPEPIILTVRTTFVCLLNRNRWTWKCVMSCAETYLLTDWLWSQTEVMSTRVGLVLKVKTAAFFQTKTVVFCTLDKVTTGYNLFLAITPLFEEISRFPWKMLVHYHEPSSTRDHMTQMTLTLTFEMPICAILAYNSYLKLY